MIVSSNNINTRSTITLAQTELNLILLYHKSSQLSLFIPSWLMNFFFPPTKSTTNLQGAEENLQVCWFWICLVSNIHQETNYSRKSSEIGLLSDNTAYRTQNQKHTEHISTRRYSSGQRQTPDILASHQKSPTISGA